MVSAGSVIERLLPRLELVSPAVSGELSIAYTLPRFERPVSLYVAASLPQGNSVVLLPDGAWRPLSDAGYSPLATGLVNRSELTGLLFGRGGVFAALPAALLPGGSYLLQIAAMDEQSGRIFGAVTSTLLVIDGPGFSNR